MHTTGWTGCLTYSAFSIFTDKQSGWRSNSCRTQPQLAPRTSTASPGESQRTFTISLAEEDATSEVSRLDSPAASAGWNRVTASDVAYEDSVQHPCCSSTTTREGGASCDACMSDDSSTPCIDTTTEEVSSQSEESGSDAEETVESGCFSSTSGDEHPSDDDTQSRPQSSLQSLHSLSDISPCAPELVLDPRLYPELYPEVYPVVCVAVSPELDPELLSDACCDPDEPWD